MHRRSRHVVTMKVVRRIYYSAIFIGGLVLAVALGTPRSAFIVLFICLGVCLVVYRVIPALVVSGAARLVRGRSDSEADRIRTVVYVASWLAVFIFAPIAWSLFFGRPDPHVFDDLLDLLAVGALLAVVWLVARRRSRRQEAEPRIGDGLFPGVTLIARPIAWLLDRREAKRLKQATPPPRLP